VPRRPRTLLVAAAVAVVGASCGGSGSAITTAPPVPTSAAVSTAGSPATAGASTTGAPPAAPSSVPPAAPCAVGPQGPLPGSISAKFATALAFAPDGRLFFAERAGTVRVYQSGKTKVFATVRTMTEEPGGGYSERGLLGLAVSPTFARDRYVYAFYSDADHAHQDVIRWTDCAGSGTAPRIILRFPSGDDCCHKGGRLAFGPDGKLYVTLGDEHTASSAQDVHDVRGKVLRYNPDGTVPGDNPFGPDDPVWAFGFRNPFGMAFSTSGQLAITNNGPTGDAGSPSTGYDTVFADVLRGHGYQWANCYGYSHPLPPASSCGAGQTEPDWSSESSTAVPTGAAFVDGAGPSGYAGHLVFCTFNHGMQILAPGSPHATLTAGPPSCLLDVKEGPDHRLYFSDTQHISRLG
jgi:aldose sugar dehydrogenase